MRVPFLLAAAILASSACHKSPAAPSTTASTTTTAPTQAAPTIAAIDPALGSVDGGATVTITGTGFTNVASVTFGTILATTYTVVSDTSITAVAPANSPTTGGIVVLTAGGTNAANDATQFRWDPNPLTDLALSTTSVRAGTPVRGSIAVTYPAPPTGLRIRLTATPSQSSAALVPLTAFIQAGETSGTFQIETFFVSSPQQITLSSDHWGTKSASLTVTP